MSPRCVSGVIDNIPYHRDDDTDRRRPGREHPGSRSCPDVLWWALAIGADFGGNLTAVGASANVVMLGIARRAELSDLVLGVHPQRRG